MSIQLENLAARVLIVDDFEVVRLMLRTALGELGLSNVEEAADGKEALNKLINASDLGKPFDVVLCDWNMPEMNGIEVIQACREIKAIAQTPIVIITAETETQRVALALREGAADYVIKPIQQDILEKKLTKIFLKKASAS